MKKFLLAFCVVTFLYSCQKEKPVEPDLNKSKSEAEFSKELTEEEQLSLRLLVDDHSITESEAKRIALETLNEFQKDSDDNGNSRISDINITENFQDSEVSTFAKISSDTNVLAYIFNFGMATGGKGGYAIIAGDKRLPTVLGISETGTIGNNADPATYFIINKIDEYVKGEIGNFDNKYRPYLESALKKTGMNGDEYKNQRLTEAYRPFTIATGDWKVVYKKAPLIKVTWGQGLPYNAEVSEMCSNKPAPAGCVATAIAQICAYYKKPNYIEGRTIHWNEITSKPKAKDLTASQYKSDVPFLFRQIGKLADVDYECDGSSSNTDNARDCMILLRYRCAGEEGYNHNKVLSEIEQKRPVYMSGKSEKTSYLFFDTYTGGHAWVIDGYVKREREGLLGKWYSNEKTTYEKYTEKQTLVHCNFGWDGNSSGYYISNVFNTDAGPVAKSNIRTSSYYKYKVNMVTGIMPY